MESAMNNLEAMHPRHTEIERKFLVNTDIWEPQGTGIHYIQGYISANVKRVVRVRIAGDKAFLGVKSLVANFTRLEFEYGIPVADAHSLLGLFCKKPLVEKHRHRETHHGKLWEIDVFHGENDGLVVAEIELGSEDEEFVLPGFAIREVSMDQRYFNYNLHRKPFCGWR